jgi:hypothetical protein
MQSVSIHNFSSYSDFFDDNDENIKNNNFLLLHDLLYPNCEKNFFLKINNKKNESFVTKEIIQKNIDCFVSSFWKLQFFFGSVFSGSPFHHHSNAFNFLMHGKKLWFLTPPGFI